MRKIKQIVSAIFCLIMAVMLFQNCGQRHEENFKSIASLNNEEILETYEIDISDREISLVFEEGRPIVLTSTKESSYSFAVALEKLTDSDTTLSLIGSRIVSESLKLSDSGEYTLLKNNGAILTILLDVVPVNKEP